MKYPNVNLSERDVEPCRGASMDLVGREAAPRRTTSTEQYEADLAVIERCERQIEAQAGCPDFFGCMGHLQRACNVSGAEK